MPGQSRVAKLHISLPPDLVAYINRRREAEQGTMSGAIAESIRRDMLAERQARLDEALALDAAENVTFADAAGVVAARVLKRDAG